jgi:hypothetical protein
MRKIHIYIVLVVFGLISAVLPAAPAAAQASGDPPGLVVSEVQTTGLDATGVEVGTKEFVEVYNPSDLPLTATASSAWRLEYLSASSDGSGPATRLLADINVAVGAKSYLFFSYEGYLTGADGYFGTGNTATSGWLAKSGGHVRIVDAAGRTVDAIGWGSGVPLKEKPGSLASWWQAPIIPAGSSIRRILANDPTYTDGLAFAAPAEPDPFGGNKPLPAQPIDPETPDPDPDLDPGEQAPGPDPGSDPPSEPLGTCARVIVTELLPNPSGADAGKEFIEVYNAGESSVQLAACSLRLGTDAAMFTMPRELLTPGSYRAFYDDESGIVLPNATAQTVWLLGGNEPAGVLYANALKDNQAWALIDGQWQATDQPTPGAANVRAATTPVSAAAVLAPKLKSKPTTTPTVCPPGKEWNPATNRCRASVAAPVGSVPCKPGQQRNAETNRCRSVLGAATVPKPCPAGQERNSTTNRCRKQGAPGVANLVKVSDVNGPSAVSDIRWWIAGLLAAGAVSYALYEWRKELSDRLYKLKIKYSIKK